MTTEALRETRRTSVIAIGPDTVRACEPECRNYVLSALGVAAGRNQWKYKPSGAASVHVAWNDRDYAVTWKRCKPSALYCDQCGDEWMTRIPEAVRQAAERAGVPRPSNAVKGLKPIRRHAVSVSAHPG